MCHFSLNFFGQRKSQSQRHSDVTERNNLLWKKQLLSETVMKFAYSPHIHILKFFYGYIIWDIWIKVFWRDLGWGLAPHPPSANLKKRIIMLIFIEKNSVKMTFYLEKSSLDQCSGVVEKTKFCQLTLPSGIWIGKIG